MKKKTYSNYSKERHSIIKEYNRLVNLGYKVDIKYRLPTVKELKTYPLQQQKQIIARAKRATPKSVRRTAYKLVAKVKGKEIKVSKVSYKKLKSEEASKRQKKRILEQKEDIRKAEEYWHEQSLGLQKTKDDVNADNYETWKEATVSGDTDMPYEEWIDSVKSGPEIDELFNNAMVGMNQEAPGLGEWFQVAYNKAKHETTDAEMLNRMRKAEGEVPEFDIYYHNWYGNVPSYAKINKMLTIIKGRPATAVEQRTLGAILERESGK